MTRSIRNVSNVTFIAIALLFTNHSVAQQQFNIPPATSAAISTLQLQPGLWELKRSDVENNKAYSRCMEKGDWETAKWRATGKLNPPYCTLAEVIVIGRIIKTTFACENSVLIEEMEFSGATMRSSGSEILKGSSSRRTLMEGTGRLLGPCAGSK